MNKSKILVAALGLSLTQLNSASADLKCNNKVDMCDGAYYDNNGVCTFTPAGYYGTMDLYDYTITTTDSVSGKEMTCAEDEISLNLKLLTCSVHDSCYYAYPSITICPKGWYCPGAIWLNIIKCPADTTTAGTGSTSLSDCNICTKVGYGWNGSQCVCQAGYGGNACTICAKGTYKSATGTSTCISCGAGKTTASTGSTSADDCSICDVGYGGASCKRCAKGTYKNTTGTEECTGCGAGKTTAGTGSTTSSACVCAEGYGGSSCKICAKGTYKSATGPAECTPCPNNGTTDTTGATSEDQCIATTPKLCEFGATMLHVGDYVFNLYPNEECASPAIRIGLDDGVCCAKLQKGEGVNALHVRYNGEVYHTVN